MLSAQWFKPFFASTLLFLSIGCIPPAPEEDPTLQDGDGDGIPAAEDCDDTDAETAPGKPELCDEVDNDCDSLVDEDPADASTWYIDQDSDGFGSSEAMSTACSAPVGYTSTLGDCDDEQGQVNPDAAESCNQLDDNCNGKTDEGVQSTFYADEDDDGYGNPDTSTQACTAPSGYSSDQSDCRDNNASVHPGAAETCNGLDDNCSGQIDEGFTLSTFHPDMDGDGYGDQGSSLEACVAPEDAVVDGSDCDDSNGTIHPDGTEICNLADDNCNGTVDEGFSISKWYTDLDQDGYGDPEQWEEACTQPTGAVANNQDCNDSDPNVHPGATEICNGKDDNCNNVTDDGGSALVYQDQDGDGYGDPDISTAQCPVPSGYVSNADDCDDTNSSIQPGAAEQCNFRDDDCDGIIDEGIDFLDIEAGEAHVLALCSDGTLWAWGFNGSGQLGDDSYETRAVPAQVTSITGVVAISAGYQHSLAVLQDGTVWAWGYNADGQVGDGTTVSRTTPRQVTSISGRARAVAAGASHSMALLENGSVMAWGGNSDGQLGNGLTTLSKTAVMVSDLTGVAQLRAGAYHSLAIDETGSVWSWGAGSYGQLGHGTTGSRTTPGKIAGLANAVSVAGGQGHTLVAVANGTVYAFGRNSNGQLGTGGTAATTLPVMIPGLAGVEVVSAGAQHSLAITDVGAESWGANWEGQLGIPSADACDPNLPTNLTCVKQPAQIPGLSNLRDIGAGYVFSVALSLDDVIYSWGSNAQSQLGDGTTENHTSPVVIVGE